MKYEKIRDGLAGLRTFLELMKNASNRMDTNKVFSSQNSLNVLYEFICNYVSKNPDEFSDYENSEIAYELDDICRESDKIMQIFKENISRASA